VVVEEAAWARHRGLLPRLEAAAEAARRAVRLPVKRQFTILLAADARLKALNTDFRGKRKATNVLSFPSDAPDYAGDIALAHGVTKAEALQAKKTFADHAVHLVVHGVLHLAGYDHMTERDAGVMEPLETKILATLGVPDPYGSTGREKPKTFPSGRAAQNKRARA
jgi:probable rRNA maturation factor